MMIDELDEVLDDFHFAVMEKNELKQQNADLVAVTRVFFKVVVVDGKQYRPGLLLCGGCPQLTVARGFECFYKPQTTECEYPDMIRKDGLAQVKGDQS